MKKIWFFFTLFAGHTVAAQPQPGEVFREYHWVPSQVKESLNFLRVGGKLDYTINPDHFPSESHSDGYISLPHDVTLSNATKAEVIVEKVLSHEGTRGLSVQINEQAWLPLPEADSIPEPAYDYMHHFSPIVEIPIEHLEEGNGNAFRFRVDTAQYWNWPQNLLYGVTLRVYYDEASPWTSANSPVQVTPTESELRLSLNTEDQLDIQRVDYVGYYEDADWEGNGQFRQWHAHLHRGEIIGHIGSATEAPFTLPWNTDWLPDQVEPMKLYARVTTREGLTYATPELDSLELPSRDFSVKLYKPQDVPAQWVTRSGEFSESITIAEDVQQATAYQLIWISWSPCYSNGILLNGHLVYSREDPCYDAMLHVVTQEDTHVLEAGKNTITTLKTPLFRGQMVHGMEVQWPGIMLKARYDLLK